MKPRALALVAIVLYLAISLDHLSVFPRVGEDEPWIAAAPYSLATTGVYGSELFSGYYGVERHNYQQMPLYPILEAGVFKVFGVGVVQMRGLSVFFGLCLLLAVFAAGRLIGGERVGALAALLMVALRVAAVEHATGIVLLDRARVNRYDVAVPVFGLLAFLVFERAERLRGRWAYAACGALIGLAALSHLYGVFWLPALGAVVLLRRGWRGIVGREPWLVVAGLVVTWIPWALYVASGWSDYRGQMLFVASRVDVFHLSFYASNLLRGPGPISVHWLAETLPRVPWWRVGTWTTFFGVPIALATMLREAYVGRTFVSAVALAKTDKSGHSAAFAVCSIVQLVMFVVLLQVKTYSYMIALWPLGALSLAWFGVSLWDQYRFTLARTALVGLCALLVLQGSVAVVRAHEEATHSTPYDFYEAQVARCIPPGSRVLGLQHYWLGLRQFPYRTWLMPLNMAHPLYSDHPVPLEQALEIVKPDVILIDHYMREMLGEAAPANHPNHRYVVGLDAFMAGHRVQPGCVVHDPTYGTMEVYLVPRP